MSSHNDSIARRQLDVHYPNIRLIDSFAEAVNIPVVKAETSGVKETEVEDLKRLIEKLDVDV